VPVEKSSVPLYVFVPDREPDLLTDSHDKLDILVDTQELLNTSHLRIGFEYDEDTASLVVDPTLSTLDILISDNSDSSTGNTSTFKNECYEVKDDTPWFNYHGPKIKIPKQESSVTICTADTIGTIRSQRLFWVLFDSGSNVSTIKRSALLKGIITKLLGDTKLVRTLKEHLKMQEVVTMQDIRLQEFNKNRGINQQKVLVFDNDNVKYNIILGTNFLSKTGIKLNYSEGNMEWFDCSIPLCPPGGLDSKEFDAMEDMFHIQVEDEIFGEDWLECFAAEILDAKYDKTDVADVVKGLTHLNAHQKADLLKVLQENNKMFNETFGVYPHKKVHIDIDPNAKPVHSRPCPVPQIHLKTFEKELDHLVRIGVLAAQQESEWA
jgi:hypothetical protein